jgi:CHAT domain-containing protein
LLFALSRLQRDGVSEQSRRGALGIVEAATAGLVASVVPRRVLDGSGPVVVVPTEQLHGLPWSLLLGTVARPTVVAPSLTSWYTARASREAGSARAVLVAGPDLAQGAAETAAIGALHGWRTAPIQLTADDATVESCLRHLETSSIAHFACHGSFRSDNPMFSSLRLADGELTVYDLERCDTLPRTIVMSACNAGQNAVLLGGALLGMASALIQLGVSSVIAPLTPVNDQRSVDLMVRLHTHLAAGVEPAEALARASVGPDGSLDPTAAPFICFGS